MGIQQRVVKQTITEYVCDLCKKVVRDKDATVGNLSVKPAGARGRPRQIDVVFHPQCLSRIADGGRPRAAKKPAGRKKGAARKAGAKKRASAGSKS
ncbi:MAG TPA: hypothetical protein VM840_00650 [Actinomycetota bacterium]|nr:hypothetical protein [Actinomycetota bacterium]